MEKMTGRCQAQRSKQLPGQPTLIASSPPQPPPPHHHHHHAHVSASINFCLVKLACMQCTCKCITISPHTYPPLLSNPPSHTHTKDHTSTSPTTCPPSRMLTSIAMISGRKEGHYYRMVYEQTSNYILLQYKLVNISLQ